MNLTSLTQWARGLGRTSLLVLALSIAPVTTLAATPTEVLEPYRAYKAAIASGDDKAALKHAKQAYEASDTLLGDTPRTGVLAHNYAELLFAADPEAAIQYFKRAIELTPNDSATNRELNAQRYVRVGQSWLRIPDLQSINVRKMKRDFEASYTFMTEHNMIETTYGAEALVLDAVRLYLDEDREEAVVNLDRALEIFDSPAHTVVSPYRYEAHLLKGDILQNDDKPIEAALSYQIVMQNLEGDVSAEHPFINKAFNRWMQARGIIGHKDLTEDAIKAGVCKCWPYEEMSAKAPLPKLRVPPRMPSSARRSGHVLVIFDVDREGQPYNIRARGATDRTFVKPALKSIENWEYEISDELADEDLQGIVSKITFRLADERGRIYPEGDLVMMEEPG